MKGIFHKVLKSADEDLENLKDDSKSSGLPIAVPDLDYLADEVIKELQKEYQDEASE